MSGSMVRCTYCGQTYDLQKVEVTARHMDCTAFVTPCCRKQADDREWVSLPAFTRVDRELMFACDTYGNTR